MSTQLKEAHWTENWINKVDFNKCYSKVKENQSKTNSEKNFIKKTLLLTKEYWDNYKVQKIIKKIYPKY